MIKGWWKYWKKLSLTNELPKKRKKWRYKKEYWWKKWTINLKIEKSCGSWCGDRYHPPKIQEAKKHRKWSWKIDYERTVSECKKSRSLIQNVVMRNTNIISQKEYNNSKMEYVHIVKESVTPKKNYVILSEV